MSCQPQLHGELAAKVGKDVEVVRDTWGVPHIRAASMHDAYYALGFVQAQDRMFQMDLVRRALSGRLAEMGGPSLLAADKRVRTLGLLRMAEERLAKRPPPASLLRYVEGINAALETQPRPLENWLIGRPEPFTPAHSLAVAHYMALGFGEGFTVDPIAGSIAKDYPDKLKALWSDYPAFAPTIVTRLRDDVLDGFHQVGLDLFHGSNAWVVAAHKSATGSNVLANDPHIGFTNPSIWYEAHITTPEVDVYGYYLPITPYPVLGHTPHHAWGVTMYENDDMDFVHEDGTDVVATTEIIKVKGQADVEHVVKRTPRGPLVEEGMSLRWAVAHEDNDPVRALEPLAFAKSWDEFSASLRWLLAPGLNMLYADKDTIAYIAAGALPVRGGGADGSLPLTLAQDWQGLEPFEKWPRVVNPPSGVIVSANNKPTRDAPRGYWQPAYRATRITQELSRREKVSIEDHLALQIDTHMLAAERLLAVVLPLIRGDAQLLSEWRHDARIDSKAPHQYSELRRALFMEAVEDELGERAARLYGVQAASHILDKLLDEPDNVWWDDVRTPEREGMREIAQRAWEKLPPAREWGEVHTITFKHPILSWFSIGPFPVAGGREAVNNMLDARYDVVAGPSTRRVVDMADPFHAWTILPTGQSGRRTSKHYADQTALYLAGRGRQIQMADIEVESRLWLRAK